MLLLGAGLQSQNLNPFFDALRKMDMNTVSDMMDQRVQYCFNDQIEVAEKQVVIKALKAFLDRNAPKAINPMHKGSSKGEDSIFSIASMETQSGKKFRIYVYSETQGGKWYIQELRIDKQ